jgi:hypothetical protein
MKSLNLEHNTRKSMKRLMFVLFLLLVLKIQSFACEAQDFKKQLIQNVEKSVNSNCVEVLLNKEKKSLIINCNNQKNYTISYDEKSVYLLTQTISKYPYISQCWIEGLITSQCSIQLASEKCQSWDMKD